MSPSRVSSGVGAGLLILLIAALTARPLPAATPEITKLLDECHIVHPNVARFVIIPTVPTGRPRADFKLTMIGLLAPNIAVTRYAVLKEGIEKEVLRVMPGQYSVVLADPLTRRVIRTFSGRGVSSFEIATRDAEDPLMSFVQPGDDASNIDWSQAGRTETLGGRCNIMNLVVLPK